MVAQTIYAASNISGTTQSPNNAWGAPNNTWSGYPNANTSWSYRWGMGNPTLPTLEASQQTVVARVRKGSNSNNPSAELRVYHDGVQVASSGNTTITSSTTTGQNLTASWTPAEGSSATTVEVEIVATSAGGSPSARNSVEVDAFTWTAQLYQPILYLSGQVVSTSAVLAPTLGSRRSLSGTVEVYSVVDVYRPPTPARTGRAYTGRTWTGLDPEPPAAATRYLFDGSSLIPLGARVIV